MPLWQTQTPATIAAGVLGFTVSSLEALAAASPAPETNGAPRTVAPSNPRTQIPQHRIAIIALDSRTGDGVPAVEHVLNASREQGREVPFKLTDPTPNPYLDSWIDLAEDTDHLQFLPQSIDLTASKDPPRSVISRTSRSYGRERGDIGHEALMLYFWLGGLHATLKSNGSQVRRQSSQSSAAALQKPTTAPQDPRMTDAETTPLLAKSTPSDPVRNAIRHALDNSDGFAVFSLEDRRLTTVLATLVFRFWLLWASIVLTFPWHRDILSLLFSLPVPIVPALGAWEAMKNALGSVTFDELCAIASEVKTGSRSGQQGWYEASHADANVCAEVDGWTLEQRRQKYRWPCGWVTAFVGRRKDVRSRTEAQ